MTPIAPRVVGQSILVIRAIHRARQHQLPIIVKTFNPLRLGLGLAHRRQKNARQNGNNRNYHQEFNQSETTPRVRSAGKISTKFVHTPGGPGLRHGSNSTTVKPGVKTEAQRAPQKAGTNRRLAPLIHGSRMTGHLEFEDLVNRYYAALYQFALSLTQAEADAADLTQQTFYRWATRGHQLRDLSKIKTWLFTTLHREFLQRRRRNTRFPHLQLDEADTELPTLTPDTVNQVDWEVVLRALGRLEETLQAPLALFYLEECSYNEIAEILDIPLGTVKSRIFRGMSQLQQSLRGDIQPFASERRVHE